MYPDLVGLGEADPRRFQSSGDTSPTAHHRHPRPRYHASWLSLKVGSIDTATLVDEDSPLPTHYHRKHSIESTIMTADSPYTQVVWELVKGWKELVASKVKSIGASAVSFYKSTLC
jgi:hypothetical protein